MTLLDSPALRPTHRRDLSGPALRLKRQQANLLFVCAAKIVGPLRFAERRRSLTASTAGSEERRRPFRRSPELALTIGRTIGYWRRRAESKASSPALHRGWRTDSRSSSWAAILALTRIGQTRLSACRGKVLKLFWLFDCFWADEAV
jgi:hypothetical protein